MCGRHSGDHTKHLQNHWDVGDPGVYLAALGSLNALANKIKKEPTTHSNSATHFWNKQKSRSSQAGYNTCLRRPLEQLRRTLFRQGTPVMVRRWTLGKQTLDPQTLLRLPACIAVFEEVEQERQILDADPLTTVSDQPCWGLWGGLNGNCGEQTARCMEFV